MKLLIAYYLVGVVVSLYFINYYRFSRKTKSRPRRKDSLLALIGPWVFPLQILIHFFRKR